MLPRGMVESSLRDVYGDPGRVTPELVDRYFDLATRGRQSRGARASVSPVAARRRCRTRLGREDPTAILWGGRDRLIPRRMPRRFHRAIAGSEVMMFDSLGHVPRRKTRP